MEWLKRMWQIVTDRWQRSAMPRLAGGLGGALFALALIALPLTSFPLLMKVTGSQVAPLSAIPLALLAVLWLAPRLLRRGGLPAESRPLLVFTLAAAAITAAAPFLDVFFIKERTFAGQALRALVTLATGLLFYFMVSTWLRDEIRLRRALRWINTGGALLLAWCFYQEFIILAFDSQYPPLVARLRDLLVYQYFTVQLSGRVSGLAYEPSWLTHQLLVLYFPLWLAAAFQRRSAFSFRLWKITLEDLLLGLGLVALMLAAPRVSMLSLVLVMAYLFTRVTAALFRRIVALLTRRWQRVQLARLVTALGLLLAFTLIFGLTIWGFLQAGSQRDWRLALITESRLTPQEWRAITRFDENSLLYLGMKFAFLERTTYWVTGWHVFNDYPLFGVGLGNAGFFMTERLPAVGWGTFEVRALVYRGAALLNTKSLWVRLLAETGLVGFALFASWLWVLWRSAAAAERRPEPILHLAGLAGKLALVAMLMEGFSIDSFAMPYFWIMAGIITAARRISSVEQQRQDNLPAVDLNP